MSRQEGHAVNPLDGMGLTPADSVTYRALLPVPSSDIPTLATETGLSTAELLAALARLEDKGLVSRATSSAAAFSARFAAAAPDLALEPILVEREQALQRSRDSLSEMVEEFRNARAHQAAELVEVISGAEAIRQRLHQLQLRARTEILAITKPPFAEVANDPELEVLARGVRVRSLYGREALERPEHLASIRSHIVAGEEARVTGQVPVKLVVFDAELALLPLSSAGGRNAAEGALLVYSSGLVDSLVALFETLWVLGAPLEEITLPGTGGRSEPSDREILALLFTGLTDAAIARQLGTSPRTVQRMVRALMDRYGAQSRFQLGALTQERGLLS